MDAEEAQARYISLVTTISPGWRGEMLSDSLPHHHDQQGKSETDGWVSVSTMAAAEGDPDAAPWMKSEQLHQAAAEGDVVAVARILEQRDCDVNAVDSEGSTALHYAADQGFVEVAQELLAHGAAVNIADNDGQTPLMLAATCQQLEVARLLVGAGAQLPCETDVDKDASEFLQSL